jgi:hypothetical protein
MKMKKKKYQRGGFEQGFRAREDESLGMRTGAARTRLQDMAARRADSYGAWGRRPNQMINRDEGGGTPGPGGDDRSVVGPRPTVSGATSSSISDDDMTFLEGVVAATGEGTFRAALRAAFSKLSKKTDGTKSINSISNKDVEFLADAYKEGKKDTPKHRGTGPKNAKGGVASFAHGNIVRAGEEGSRLSVSMEKQEDAGFSPSEADFREQHKLALEGVMEVGADVTIVQGHDSREQLGETDEARGMGAAVKGTGFKGVF